MECRDSVTFRKLTSLDHEFRKHCIKSETRVIVEWFYRENTENTAKIGLVVTLEEKLNKIL